MSKTKILFIFPLPPPVHGSAMMSQYIKDNKFINDSLDCDYVNLSTSREMNEIGCFSINKIFRFLYSYILVLWKLITHRYDICYLAITCHGIGFLKDMPFVWLAKCFARKVVLHQHNKGMASCVKRFPYNFLLKWTYRNTKVILLSWLLYEDVSEVVAREQVLICPNGIPEEEGALLEKSQTTGIPHFLFLSNLIPSKGVLVLLDACQILKSKGYRFFCDFVGGETQEISRTKFEMEVKKRGLEDYCLYHGPKYGKDKVDFLRKTDALVFPTFFLNETFGLVLLEAMQHAVPVITTREGGIPDVVQDGVTGFVCSSKNVDSLAEKMEKLVLDRELGRRMGMAGRARYLEKFTLSVFQENLCKALNSCRR